MAIAIEPIVAQEIVYPDSDGQPMADNTKQFRWIVTIQGGLDTLFRDDPNVFVAGDLLWYPVEGKPTIRAAPDAMVVFGRPKGDRGSYQQWREGGVAPQVVFEVLSPGNSVPEMARKYNFYQRYGVEEYYLYDPDNGDLIGWTRTDDFLSEIPSMSSWVSPRLHVRFDLEGQDLVMYYPDDQRFKSYVEIAEQARVAQQQAEAALTRADRLAARLQALGIDPDQIDE